jgi:hypothetical protein
MTITAVQPSTVTLTPIEHALAVYGGTLRQSQNIRAGLHNAHGLKGAGWSEQITGACAEYAVAKCLDLFWSPGTRGAHDVGAYEVRFNASRPPVLILHPKDDDQAVFILVCGGPYEYTLAGWCYGWAGKAQRYWDDPTSQNRPAFFIPVRDLSPMSDLPAL